ncbi:site-specific integrase [Litchfieldella xinjiangensis]|uniref:site-specific integrase n=1 Tax=Litchfieldella xinjiangensis TaxID=1166948 RepID=UPI000AB4ED09|nr:site-specific integrase [Halomonas xinjiangensis]
MPKLTTIEKLFKSYGRYRKDHRSDMFEDLTYYKYLEESLSFLDKILIEEMSTITTKKEMKELLTQDFKLIKIALASLANSKTSDSWRKSRRALEVLYKASGLSSHAQQIRSLENPISVPNRSHNTKKSRRLNNVSDQLIQEMLLNRKKKNDIDSIVLIMLGRFFGIRPSEAPRIEIIYYDLEIIKVKIHGSKKTLLGKKHPRLSRGIDRILSIPYRPSLINSINKARELDEKRIKAAQMRIHRASRKILKNEKKQFCLYSLRYTFGSNLKRQLYDTKNGRIIAAAIMGHKNTSSISSYGHYRSGKRGVTVPKVDVETTKLVNDDVARKYFKKEGEVFDVGQAIKQRAYQQKQKTLDAESEQEYSIEYSTSLNPDN